MTTLKIARASALSITAALLTAAGCEEDVGEGDSPGAYTIRVSINSFEEEVTGPANGSQSCSVSADGRYVAFQSDAPDLVPGDSNGWADIFVKDRATGAVELVSLNTDFNLQGTFPSSDPSISADGRYVAFISNISLALGLGDAGDNMAFVHDRFDKTTRRVLASNINPNGGFFRPRISGDGQYVAFLSNATNLGGTGTNPSTSNFQIWRSQWDQPTPAIVLASGTAAAPVTGTAGQCDHPSISFDGQKVAFMSDGDDVSTEDVNGINDVFVADPPGTAPKLLSRAAGEFGTAGDGSSDMPFLSSDGTCAAFLSTAESIIGTTTPPTTVVRRRLVAPFDTVPVSINRLGALIPNCISPCLSADGDVVAFAARPSPEAGVQQIWAGVPGGAIPYASLHLSGAFADKQCDSPSLSGDGRWVGFSTAATNLILRDGNGQNDIFVRGPLR